MTKIRRIFSQTMSSLYPAEKLAILIFLSSVALFASTGIPYNYIVVELATGVFRLALFFLPVIILRFALDFSKVNKSRSRLVYTIYFLFVLILFLFSPMLGYNPTLFGLIKLSANFKLAGLLMLLVYVLLSSKARSADPEKHRTVAREHLLSLGILARAMAVLILCYLVYSNLKAVIPIFRDYSWDAAAYRLDLALCLGNDPFKTLHAWLPTREYTPFFHLAYFFFFYFNAFGLSGAFVFGSPRYLMKVIHTVVFAYFIGLAIYWTVPTLGPFLYSETAYIFEGMADGPHLKQHLTRTLLRVISSPHDFKIQPFDGIAAFPSLHIAHSLIYMYFLWPKQRLITALLTIPLFFLTLSTIYLGWHYVIDIPAGALVAVAAVWLVSRTIKDPETRGPE